MGVFGGRGQAAPLLASGGFDTMIVGHGSTLIENRLQKRAVEEDRTVAIV
jgi:hypothetical protein